MPVVQGNTVCFSMARLVIEADHKDLLFPKHLQTPPDSPVFKLTHTGIKDEFR
jgi:hypothetical protein